MKTTLPMNWVKSSLKQITRTVKGKKPKIQSEIEFKNSIPYMDIKALEYNEIRQYADVESSKLFEKGDVAMVWDGARSGWVSKTNFGAIGSTITAFKPFKLNSDYLFYYLLNIYPYINSNARGVGIPHVDPTVLYSLEFPLSPLPEQQRIVAKLDTLFGHLHILKKRLDTIPGLLKNFRQAILSQAVTGKLTTEWREGKELDEWKETTLEKLVVFAGNGLSKRRGDGHNITVLRLADFKNGIRIYGKEREIQLTEKEQIKYILNKNDLLIIRVNGSVELAGLFILYNEEKLTEAYCDHFIRLTVDSDQIIPLYLTYITNNGDGRIYLKNSLSTSAGQNTINQKSVKGLDLRLPPIEEQIEIVRRVESLFAKADGIEAKYNSLKQQIDKLPQAILAKAFKGELVEQLPTDGDAKDLLAEIQKLKAATEGNKKKKGKRK